MTDEAALARQVAAGDRQAFAQLVARHLPAIEAFAVRTLGDPDRAQDVAQDVMLRLWHQAARFDSGKARLATWLHQIAYHRCMDLFRDNARWQALAPEHEEVDPSDGDLASLPIARCLAALPERQRTALVLTYYQEFTNREVADIMGLSIRALESLLVRARRSLRQALEESV